MFVDTILDANEYRHEPDADPTYNESTYYNFGSPANGIVGWVRVAMQQNQPSGQATAIIFVPDSNTYLSFLRTTDVSPDRFEVGPIRVDIIEPHRRAQLSFDGEMSVFTDPRVLADPKKAFAEAPKASVRADITWHGNGASFGSNGDDPDSILEESMALGHFEQFGDVTGRIRIGDRSYELDGGGLRDHSWGPRSWQGPHFYRWIIATLNDDTRIMTMEVSRRDGVLTRRAAVVKDKHREEIQLNGMTNEWTDDGFVRRHVSEITTKDGQLTLTATIRQPEKFVPLRHTLKLEDGSMHVTRIGYAAYEFSTSDGRTGLGICEILDQLVDGLPVGMTGKVDTL